MTELLEGELGVLTGPGGLPEVLVASGGRRRVEAVAARWRVETDWWRSPVRRDYFRCLLDDAECVDLYRDLETGLWHWSRRHD